jgi:transcriptional regulator with XRE-family HTH domain
MPKKTTIRAAGDVDAYVGHRIRALRIAKDMSQTALAERLGLTFQQVQKYEKGINRVVAGRLAAIAAILDVEVAALYPKQDRVASPQGDLLMQMLGTQCGHELAAAFLALDAATRRLLLQVAEELAAGKRVTAARRKAA